MRVLYFDVYTNALFVSKYIFFTFLFCAVFMIEIGKYASLSFHLVISTIAPLA